MDLHVNKIHMKTLKLSSSSLKYHVNEKKGTVVAIEEFYFPGYIMGFNANECRAIGIAHVKEGDTFNEETGKRIARAKAEKIAFANYRALLKDYQKTLKRLLKTAENTIIQMNSNIKHQEEYLKSF